MGVKTGSDFNTELDKATYVNVDEKLLLYFDQHIKYAVLPVTIAAATTQQLAANDVAGNAVVIPAQSIVKSVFLYVATAEATGTTKTIDVGIYGGDADGFLDGASVAAVGTVKGTLLSTGQTKGVLLAANEDGSGGLVPEDYVCSADTRIGYSLGADDFAELVAYIIVEYLEVA